MSGMHARPRDLVELLRRARVEGRPIALRAPPGAEEVTTIRLTAGPDASVTLDGHNGLADIDGALTLSSVARRLERLGATFPLARPLPPLSMAVACAALPFFADAYVQQASGLTLDGDEWESPRAPRAAAGPSLVASLCTRPPLAIALRARVRVLASTHAVCAREEHPDVDATARRIGELIDDGRAFTVDACRTSILVLAGGTLPRAGTWTIAPFTHEGRGRSASFARSQSLVPGDVAALADALRRGARIVAAPFMGRAAALWRGFEELPILELRRGLGAVADALTAASPPSSILNVGGRT